MKKLNRKKNFLRWGILFTIIGIWSGIGLPIFMIFGQNLLESIGPSEMPNPNFLMNLIMILFVIIGIVVATGGIIMLIYRKKNLI